MPITVPMHGKLYSQSYNLLVFVFAKRPLSIYLVTLMGSCCSIKSGWMRFSRINYYSRINIYFVRDWSKSIGGRGGGGGPEQRGDGSSVFEQC